MEGLIIIKRWHCTGGDSMPYFLKKLEGRFRRLYVGRNAFPFLQMITYLFPHSARTFPKETQVLLEVLPTRTKDIPSGEDPCEAAGSAKEQEQTGKDCSLTFFHAVS